MLLPILLLQSAMLACAPPPPLPSPAGLSDPGVSALATEGPVEQRVSTAPADLVLFYAGEHKGSIETCGCPNRPRGSITRMHTYMQASRQANPGVPDLLLHGGYWLDDAMDFEGGLRADVPVMNRWMREALDAVQVDAANVSHHDLPGLLGLGPELPEWAVSANIRRTDPDMPQIARWRIIERGGLRIGVTGITKMGVTLSGGLGYEIEDPYTPGKQTLEELAPMVDVLVLLSYHTDEVARALVTAVPQVDVVIDTNMHRAFYEPATLGDTLWLRSHYQTMRLGELRLKMGEGRPELVIDRRIDLDPQVPDSPALSALVRSARAEIEETQKQLFEDSP